MDLENWNLYYKTHESTGELTTTQMCYEPRINPEGNVFCMNFSYPNEYQSKQVRLCYDKNHIEFMFERECKYLKIFESKPYAPEVLDIKDNKIFIKWYGNTCNDLIFKHKNLNENWYEDISTIIYDQVNLGYLKATIYPHSHYYDTNGQMHCIDFYATVEKENPFVELENVKSIIGFDTDRFSKATIESKVNVELLFKSGLTHFGKWPINLTDIHKKIYG